MAVVCHSGKTLSGGHYLAFVLDDTGKDGGKGKGKGKDKDNKGKSNWLKISDASVSSLGDEDVLLKDRMVLEQSAVLFYRRRGMPKTRDADQATWLW